MRYTSRHGQDDNASAQAPAPFVVPFTEPNRDHGHRVNGHGGLDGKVALNRERGVASAYDQSHNRAAADPAQALQRLAGDARLAAVFKQIRAILGITEMEMARRLSTDIGTVLDFESGVVEALPPWPITARLVERYAILGGVDPAPILTRLINLQTPALAPTEPAPVRLPSTPVSPLQRSPQAAHRTPQPTPPAPPLEPATEAPHLGFAGRSKVRTVTTDAERTRTASAARTDNIADVAMRTRRRRRVRRTILAASPFLVLVSIFALLQVAPRPIYAATRVLPGAVGSTARGLVDVMAMQTAHYKDGLRWIDAGDPRLRKGDRLSGR
jgi:transcriptional regulator with XRE-family HTH domain